ncbi:polysaccharide pyruvyl transferase family protein [Zhongshania aquimaris]|uniref:Polysaccharide pyruvyl transferase family protein n=1 Tax=Zhongshania aquimaris TaxID=2857107 RepID=A0ABS6VRC7_9GAMM|nr:polysaccharide pyruvyl transferase family protein [Zhongshania aquimaris]MBW2940878.1 polysaccharide pyruvyl transferase family protein [Zhongshania aquimaris]
MKIGLMWHSFGNGNLGVVALSISNMSIISEAAESLGVTPEFIVFGPKLQSGGKLELDDISNVKYVELSMPVLFSSKVLRVVRELNCCDVLFDIGSGDSFSDIYGVKRFSKMIFSKFLIRNSTIKLIMSPQTIGPFKNRFFKWLAALSISRCRLVYARDKPSFDYARISMSCKNVQLSTDVALTMPYTVKNNLASTGSIRVGVNVSGLLMSGGYSGENQFELSVDYRVLMTDFISYLVSHKSVEVYLVSHVFGSGSMVAEDDYAAACELHNLYPSTILCGKYSDPREIKGLISEMDFFVAARMHASIAAFSSGVPVIPLAYSRKFKGLYGSLGYDRVVDMKSVNNDEALRALIDAFCDLEKVSGEVSISNANGRKVINTYKRDVQEVLRGCGA